jgi:hypothetical protein
MKTEIPTMSSERSTLKLPIGSIRNHFASAALSTTENIPAP